MKAWASLFIFVFLSTPLAAKENFVVKYDDLPKIIQQNSKDVRAAELLTEASAARHGYQARARYPRLGVESGLRGVRELDESGDNAPFFKVEGSVNLYRGSRDALKDSLQEKETAIRKEETQLVLRSQLSLARELFLRLASIQELKRAWADAVKITQNKKKSSKLKINAGLTTNTDLLEFELYEATLKREKRKLDKEENELSNKLRILLGLSEETEISLDKGFFQPTEPNERNYKLATEAHPAVRKLALQADQAQAISNSGVSRWTPEVDAFASYEEYLIGEKEIPGALPRRDFATGVRVSIPLGDNLTSQNEANARKLEASAYDLQKQQNARQIELVFNARLRDMKVLYELIQDSKNQLEKARKYLKQTSDEYERGIKNGPDVLEASRTLYMTQVESIQLIFEYYLAEVGLHAVAQD